VLKFLVRGFAFRSRRPERPRSSFLTAAKACILRELVLLAVVEATILYQFDTPVSKPKRKLNSMSDTPILMHEQQYSRIKTVLARLRLDSAARVVFLVDKNGQQIAVQGDVGNLDTTSLASLAAGNVAATGGMAQLIGEKEFPTLSHEGEHESIHISVIGRMLLVIVFDENSSLGLVKLRSKQVSSELAKIVEEVERESIEKKATAGAIFSEITEEDIDSLFN
jgi:predicted regulator of Ras-like GTPase activity (Roadblock/LC7/MglB family)